MPGKLFEKLPKEIYRFGLCIFHSILRKLILDLSPGRKAVVKSRINRNLEEFLLRLRLLIEYLLRNKTRLLWESSVCVRGDDQRGRQQSLQIPGNFQA